METEAFPSYGSALPRRSGRLSGAGLAMLAALHVLLAVSFLIVLVLASGRAHAEDAVPQGASAGQAAAAKPACTGTNLLDRMKKSDPAEFSKIHKQAAAVPNGDSRFWKISGKGTTPSWLYGTMHVTDPRVLALPAPAAKALSAANTVVIETTAVLDPAKAQADILAKPDLTMFTDGTTLADHLDKDQLRIVKDKLAERGIAFGLVSHMKPWILATMVAVPACEEAGQSAGIDFLDKKIAEDAKAEGKTVKGLETVDEQLEALAQLPMKFHVQSLVESLQAGDQMQDVAVTMTDLYLKGEIAMIEPMLMAISPSAESAPGGGYVAFQKHIITDRDAVMAKRAQPIIDKGDAFIAVGALHLPGKDGVVALLRKAGYTVTAVR